MKLIDLAALAAALSIAAAELQAAGAIRPDHDARWAALRVSIDQLLDQLRETAAAAPVDATPDQAAFAHLSEVVELLAATVDDLADQVRALKPEA